MELGAAADALPPVFTAAISGLRSGDTRVIKLDGITTCKLQRSHFIDRGFSRDFIMIEELTAELLAAEKNVYGKVIRMMAHEVNNTIGPVNSIVQTALKTDLLWQGHQHDTLKDALQVALDRNQNLNIFMRNFADLVKLPEPIRRQIDITEVAGNVTSLMNLKATERNISVSVVNTGGPLYIQADELQMEQALINIVKNAIEAITDRGEIKLSISNHPKKLMITDSGKGISNAQSELLFTPFYTTKKDGQGIGLTLVREILTNHNFEFSLKTVEVGRTEFVILF